MSDLLFFFNLLLNVLIKLFTAFHGMPLNRTTSDPEDITEDNEVDALPEEATPPDNQMLLRLLDQNEKVSSVS